MSCLIESSGNSQRTRVNRAQTRRRSSRVKLGFGALLVLWFAAAALALPESQRTPDDKATLCDPKEPITIRVSEPLKESKQCRFGDSRPHDQAHLKFASDGKSWSFVQFAAIPKNTKLIIDGDPDGYKASEVLESGRWYPFKLRLAILVEIERDASPPIDVTFSFGGVKTNVQAFLNGPDQTAEKVREFTTSNRDQISQDASTQSLSFVWGVVPGTTAASSATPSPNASVYLPPERSRLDELMDDPLMAVVVVLGGLILVGAIGTILFKVGKWLIRRWHSRPQKRSGRGADTEASNVQQTLAEMEGGPVNQAQHLYGTSDQRDRAGKKVVFDGTANKIEQSTSSVFGLGSRPAVGETVYPPPKATPADVGMPPKSSFVTSPNQPIQSFDAERKRLDRMDADVAGLRRDLDQKANRLDQEKLMAEAKRELEGKLKQSGNDLDNRLTAAVKELETMVINESALMERTPSDLNRQVSQVDERGAQVTEKLENFLKAVLAQSKSVETQMEARLSKLQTAINLQPVTESFVNKTLGAVLGESVETLRGENFERLIGDKLNQFFETEVKHGDGLQELRVRAEGINAALKSLALQMERLNPQASADARQPMQRVEAFVNELTSLQSQMQSRRATIETMLRVPVSMHAGARQTFLEELGRGIKREIDKLNDPHNYFEGELERLITADLIAIVDICDKTIATSPGTRPELEPALKQLFEQAGLTPILPSHGEAFKTAEQDLIEMASGGGGKSLTVAQVITRGFYYKHRDNKTLLRKAGVTVYR